MRGGAEGAEGEGGGGGGGGTAPHSLFQVVMEVMGSSMLVLLMLDACRLGAGVGLCLPGVAFCENGVGRQC